MEYLYQFFAKSYYTTPINIILAIILLIISIIKRKDNEFSKYLTIYFIAYLITHFVILLEIITNSKYRSTLGELYFFLESGTTLIELTVFLTIINKSIDRKEITILLKILPWTFLAYIILKYFLSDSWGPFKLGFLQNIYTIQALILIVGAALYYFDLFRNEPTKNLSSDPSFWIITGVFFTMSGSLPFSIIGSSLVHYDYSIYLKLFVIFNILYHLLFLMILKSFLCKPSAIKSP